MVEGSTVSVVRTRGQCDICGRMGWVTREVLEGVTVAAYCKTCNVKDNDDE